MPILTTTLYFVGALLLGALIITVVSRWRKKTAGSETQSAVDQLAHFRTLYEKGELSEEEFNSLRSLLGGKIRRKEGEGKPRDAQPPQPGTAPPGGTPPAEKDPGPPDTGIRPSES
jgi:hypothetical protein